MDVDAALAYAEKHELHALVIAQGETIELECYANGYDAHKAHPLYSGTKSFWGIAALHAEADGLFSLDEPIAATLEALRADIRRSITPRMLLQLIAGYGFGGLGTAVPTYTRALEIPLKDVPATTFTYGGIPLQVFGAFFTAKLAAHKLSPHDYLRETILDPAGVRIDSWRTLKDGTHPLPTGAQLTARAWLTYGRFVLNHRVQYAQAFIGSAQNSRYGLGWWLGDDLFYASGSAGQALYVIPSLALVAVHFGRSASFKHDALLKRLRS
jgi:CubicO group peptidase (beta-lactamase class C family)